MAAVAAVVRSACRSAGACAASVAATVLVLPSTPTWPVPVAAATLTKVGQLAPDFTTTSLAGEPLALAKLRGHVLDRQQFEVVLGNGRR